MLLFPVALSLPLKNQLPLLTLQQRRAVLGRRARGGRSRPGRGCPRRRSERWRRRRHWHVRGTELFASCSGFCEPSLQLMSARRGRREPREHPAAGRKRKKRGQREIAPPQRRNEGGTKKVKREETAPVFFFFLDLDPWRQRPSPSSALPISNNHLVFFLFFRLHTKGEE